MHKDRLAVVTTTDDDSPIRVLHGLQPLFHVRWKHHAKHVLEEIREGCLRQLHIHSGYKVHVI